jgi:hypothetical protein
LILSPEWYFMRITDHKAPHYTVFSSILLGPPSYALFLNTLISNTLILCSSLNVRETKSHTHTTQQQDYSSVIVNIYVFE